MSAKKQILFVDDDEFILSCYRRLLGKRFTLETALGPALAIEALKQGPFEVVASDIRMPGMNGIELLRKVKEQSPETVGILMTGNVEMDDAQVVGNRDLFFKLLSKPCSTEDLIKALEESLERYRVNTQAESGD
ncbi:MAG TPA: response regulator [Terriglobia bacterium]|nr:response regulator [Terriglobia bacterium]